MKIEITDLPEGKEIKYISVGITFNNGEIQSVKHCDDSSINHNTGKSSINESNELNITDPSDKTNEDDKKIEIPDEMLDIEF